VKELFLTLQGEGANAGSTAVFCRFAGCNLWSGQERHRASAVCQFCDTDFVGTDGPGGGRFGSAADLADAVERTWTAGRTGTGSDDRRRRLVVCTGGEPLLQLDEAAIEALHERGFAVAVETNGTIALPPGLDWVCMSPKAGAPTVVTAGDELKLVFPQPGIEPAALRSLAFEHFWRTPSSRSTTASPTPNGG
jgi:7-carboxy-7-deazaguanine synthase (Cx14CxxC type)